MTKQQTVLITLGRLPKALDIARAFHSIGWRVVIAEPFGWHLSRVSRAVARCYKITAPNTNATQYRADLLKVVEREHVDLVMPVSEEAVYASSLINDLPEGVAFFGPDHQQMVRLHDKLHFCQLAAEQGLTVPDHAAFGTAEAEAIAQSGDYVLKPRNSATGLGVSFNSAGTALPTGVAYGDHLVQRKIEGALVSSFTLAQQGAVAVTVIYRGVVFDGTVAIAFERVTDCKAAEHWITDFVSATAYTGMVAFDFLIDQSDRAYAVECNPRATSGLHFLTESDLAAAILSVPHAEPRFRTGVLQQFYPMLTLTQASFGKWAKYRNNLRTLFRAKDVTMRWSDPLPFLLMTPMSHQILRRALFGGVSMGEAAIEDIGWFGPQGRP